MDNTVKEISDFEMQVLTVLKKNNYTTQSDVVETLKVYDDGISEKLAGVSQRIEDVKKLCDSVREDFDNRMNKNEHTLDAIKVYIKELTDLAWCLSVFFNYNSQQLRDLAYGDAREPTNAAVQGIFTIGRDLRDLETKIEEASLDK